MNFKDLFSGHSTDYAKFRPTYPNTIFAFLAECVSNRDAAWDCGTGNGQAAVELAQFFKNVVATDPSDQQLAKAAKSPRVSYQRASAESSNLPPQSVDLVTVAQAFHWFQQEQFYAEVRRVVRPGGVLAVWCYELCKVTPAIDAVIDQLYTGILSGYWEPERRLVEEGYRNVQFPFRAIQTPPFEMKAGWGLEHMVGYLKTWSALQTYIKKNGSDPLPDLFPALQKAWRAEATRSVRWELSVRAFHVD